MEKLLLNDDELDGVSGGAIIHYAANGESLASLADRYNVPVQKLMSWNNVRDPNAPFTGKLTVKK